MYIPQLTDERTRGNVVRECILGFPRDQIAEHTGIGAGTVSSIVANYKAKLDDLDFDSIRQLAVEARQLGWNFKNRSAEVPRKHTIFCIETRVQLIVVNVLATFLSKSSFSNGLFIKQSTS